MKKLFYLATILLSPSFIPNFWPHFWMSYMNYFLRLWLVVWSIALSKMQFSVAKPYSSLSRHSCDRLVPWSSYCSFLWNWCNCLRTCIGKLMSFAPRKIYYSYYARDSERRFWSAYARRKFFVRDVIYIQGNRTCVTELKRISKFKISWLWAIEYPEASNSQLLLINLSANPTVREALKLMERIFYLLVKVFGWFIFL